MAETIAMQGEVAEGARRAPAVAMMLTAATSNQAGAAVASFAFSSLGPAGVVAVRQWVAAAFLVPIARPRPWRYRRAEWLPILTLAGLYALMNLSLYSAVERIGLGLAVTLEFIGPLAVALWASRTRVDAGCALAATAAVVVVARPGTTTDLVGIAFGLTAAACWAGYIVTNRVVGQRFTGVEGSAMAATLSALAYLPVGWWVLTHRDWTLTALACAVAAGVLASVVPFTLDLMALRRLPSHVFGVFMSVHPVIAALLGLVVLGEQLTVPQWAAITVIVAANVVCVSRSNRRVRAGVAAANSV